jgi:acid phosphatase
MPLADRRLPFVLLAFLAACELPSRPDSHATIAQVRVAPDSVVLDPAQTQPFFASGRTLAGDSVAIDVTWAASAGTITPAGIYTADSSAADAVVTATLVGSHMSGTSKVRKRHVAQIVLVPAAVTLPAGGTQQFAAWGVRNTGDSVGVAITYSATGGTITSAGLYTAGQTAGTYRVIARQTNGPLADTSAVTVTAIRVASVTVAPSSAGIHVGDTLRLTATPRDSAGNVLTGRTIAWSSDSASVATVSANGLVTAVKAGTATIRATSEGKTGTAVVTVTNPGTGGVPQAGHVFIVTEENTDYASVIGSASMPYLNSLAQQYGLATQYYANTHPSIGNYFMLGTGQIITNNDSYSTIVTVDNVVRRLLSAGKTWKSYAEDLPSVGYTGADVGGYARKHNTFALLSDVANDSIQRRNLVPFTQFATDLANGTLPQFSNIVPNLCNDAHDCSLATADAWLQTHIAPLLSSATFQQDGLLIITFDESGSDNTNGGGRVAWLVVSPKAKRGYQSTTLYQHQGTLRLTLEALGISVFPGAAAAARAMSEFFTP